MKSLSLLNDIALMLLLGLFLNSGARSQQVRFKNLTVENGLSHPIVTSIVQDHDGFMWFGTHSGLNRYDGYGFKVFKHDPRDSNSLSSNAIWCLLVDHHGILWIGTLGGGLNSFNPSTGKFHRHPLFPDTSRSQYVWSLFEGKDDTLWVGMDGLHGLDTRSGGQVRFTDATVPALSSNVVRSIFEDTSGTLWIGTWLGGLNKLERDRAHITVYRNIPGRPPLFTENHIVAIHQDRDGALWLGTFGGGLNRFHPETGTVDYPTPSHVVPQNLSNTCVKSIYEDRDGSLWLATGAGIYILERKTGSVTSRISASDQTSILGNNLSAIYEDIQGTLWIATNFGISRYSRLNNRFNMIPRNFPSGYIGWFCADPSGGFYVSEGSPELRHFDPSMGSVRSLPIHATWPRGKDIEGVFADRFGLVWLITDGLERFDPVSRRQKRYSIGDADSSNTSFRVNAFHEDRAGNLWIGTSSGIARYDRTGDRFTYYGKYSTASRRDSALANVQSIAQDRTGVYWIGMEFGGLVEFDPDRGVLSQYTHNAADTMSIGSNDVTVVHEDRSGRLWLATHGAGLDRFDRATRTFLHLGEADGLAGNYVCGLVEDEGGMLWVSTPAGLSCVNPHTRAIRTYGGADGLTGLQDAAYALSSNGEILVGNEHNLFSFRPTSLPVNTHAPNVVITSFMVLNEPFPLPEPISATRTIALDHTQNFFSFEFAALDFVAPELNRYAYRLEGVDRDWVQAGTRRLANYTHLDPGTYTFRVKASNNDGLWNQEGAALTILIDPPFQDAWWFRVLAGLGILGILALAYNRRVNKLVALERIRVRIARDLHDELGSNLSGIALASRLMQGGANLTEQQEHRLTEINSSAMQTADAMREIVWFINPDHDNPGDLLRKMREIASSLLEGIKLSFEAEEDVFESSMGIEKRRQLFLIFKEILNNTVKHAHCSCVSIRIRRRGGSLSMSVEDDGVGFDPDQVSAGDGLRNLRTRAAAFGGTLSIESSPGRGTTIAMEGKTT